MQTQANDLVAAKTLTNLDQESIPPYIATSLSTDLDLLLVAIESIDLSAVEVMMLLLEQLNLTELIPTRVALWQLRCTNPLRKQARKAFIDWQEARALTAICAAIAKMLNTYIRLLVNTQAQAQQNRIELLGLQQNLALFNDYIERFFSNYRSRMKAPLSRSEAEILAGNLLVQLLFCGGTAGEARLWQVLLVKHNP
ncbi:MAG: DUF3038 domain-containing protein [Pseudanabaenaceae cyanobacterium bins.68]|nr:DUF3038 domain-containing protein [Pseudanabaenaceae cyanobacterium bins.68]